MGKSKPIDPEKIISSKSSKKAHELSEKVKALQQKAHDDAPKAAPVSKLNPASQKIKKEPIELNKGVNKEKQAQKQKAKKENKKKKAKVAQEKELVKVEIEPLDVSKYSEFVKTQTSKYNRIRKRTIEVLKLDKYQIKKAVKALITHFNKTKNQYNLLDTGDDFIYLEIILSKVPTQYSIRPIQIKLPVPIYGPQHQSRFCVFSTDPQRAYKDKIQDLNLPCIAKVVGYNKLIKKYPQFADKRKLFHDYDLFFCDYKLYNLLRKPTGKVFYKGKKIPFPIDCEKVPAHLKDEYPDYQAYLNGLCDYTYFSMSNGPVYGLKVARVSMSLKEAVKNVIHGVYNTVPHILRESLKHTSVRQISIKTANSISLPIFNQLSEEEIEAMMALDDTKEENGEDVKEDDEVEDDGEDEE